nr:TraR/DksA family transcriptional regulator [Wenjunlia vitaminophila]
MADQNPAVDDSGPDGRGRGGAGGDTAARPAPTGPASDQGEGPSVIDRTTATTGARPVAAKKKATAVSTPAAPSAVPKARGTGPVSPEDLPVRPGEDPWTQQELDELRAGLMEDVGRLREEIVVAEESISGLLRDSGDGAGDDDADTGTKNISREHEMALANNAREMLAQTEHALDRLDTGTYGYCESCGSPIGKARLLAFPRATLCVECKQRQERR